MTRVTTEITPDRGPLILASASPRRRELLARVGIEIEVTPAGADEAIRDGEDAVDHARRLAGEKADAVAAFHHDRWVLAADTVVEIDGAILGKPADAGEARGMLDRLSGATHRVTTGFALRGPRIRAAFYESTGHVTSAVTMRVIPPDELDDYLAAGEWRGKAGGYAVQGMAAAFVTEVAGSITNVVGLPLAEVLAELERAGAARPCYQKGRPA
jgi:septum formation protein